MSIKMRTFGACGGVRTHPVHPPWLRAWIIVQSGDSSCDDSDDSTGRSCIDSLLLGLSRNSSLNSLTLTINNFSPRSTKLSLTVIGCLEGCISLRSLTVTLNEYNEWKSSYTSLLRIVLRRIISLISLTLTLNIYTRERELLTTWWHL